MMLETIIKILNASGNKSCYPMDIANLGNYDVISNSYISISLNI
jgi:hypothetical protein